MTKKFAGLPLSKELVLALPFESNQIKSPPQSKELVLVRSDFDPVKMTKAEAVSLTSSLFKSYVDTKFFK